jgi:tripartite-type tricarboxylate transporter receptor subunit TctC
MLNARTSRRTALKALALPLLPALAHAQTYPDRPLKLVIGYTPGGAGDAIARLMAQKYTEVLGQPALVENRPGASATLAAAAVAKAPPDGYTLLVNTGPDSTIGPITMSNLPYSVPKDFSPISLLTIVPSVLVVPSDSPHKNVADLIKAARANPGKLNYASFGNGSSAHMSAELFKSLTKTFITHIPFKGSAPAMTELLAGRVDFLFDTFASANAQIQAGKVRALAVTSAARVPMQPNLPTMQEAGVAGFISQAFIGITAPAQTPAALIDRLNKETQRIMAMPDVRQKIASLGMVPASTTPEEYRAFLASETDRNRKLIKEAKLQFDN